MAAWQLALTLIPTGLEILIHFPSPSGRGQRVRVVGPHPHPFSRREKGASRGALCAHFFTLGELVEFDI
ncbi:MAG: hypothetical protein A2140_05775 [Candidatus Muproteobacteria bacterium RBG_16_62_13]|uniref:Uncharacterized protein n=1 Tax=Candidatus Muproteobacteria bacterium RBG_16_62_13 TaxID=1817756 RepID=A0A1F6T7V3_9PROT|nr:MAG: hypothetical protein A2140_05775 [Candidatus Muproteobacteria bacterium RBG_16_62_13]